MAINDESSSSSIVSMIGTSKYVQSFNSVHDNPNLKITSQLLDGLNYVRWAQPAKLFVGGRGKTGFLLGIEKEHAQSNPKYILREKIMLGSSNFPMRLRILNRVLRLWGCIMRDFDRVGKNYLNMIASSSGQLAYQGLNPDFEYVRVNLLDKTPFPTLEEAHVYHFSDQSGRSPMPPTSGIPSETSVMAVRYAYPVPPSVPSQTSHISSPSVSPLLVASGNSRPPRKKYDYCGIEPSPTSSIPITTDDDSHVSHTDDDKPITIRKEKHN
ncbi:hypothetical protein GIB67_014230, partial [Kingdonia uniflora]